MQEVDCKQDANTLHVTFRRNYNGQRELKSREFVLCGLVSIQLLIADISKHNSSDFDFQIVYIGSSKTFESDHFTYFIEVFSDKLKLAGKKIVVDFKSNSCWQLLQKEMKFLIEFDIKMNLKINTSSITNTAFSSLYDDMDLTDFELCGQDGTVPVHKAVLASLSPVMKAMLNGEWKETSTGVVEIPNTTKETLQQLKDYMYLKKLPESGLENLAALASCYMMADFEELWTTKLLLTLRTDNVQELLEFALKYGLKKIPMAIMLVAKHGAIDVKNLITKNGL